MRQSIAELVIEGGLERTQGSGTYVAEPKLIQDVVETAPASPMEAQLLGVDPGLPMLLIRRTASEGDGHPREYTGSVFRGDRFRFVARFRR